MKRLYAERRDALLACLGDDAGVWGGAGLSVVMHLPEGANDRELAKLALDRDISPVPLSAWWHDQAKAQQGFILGVANLKPSVIGKACQSLKELAGISS
jgi:GntR family transcriptional regulator/MocR family aminotransferase